MLISRLSIRARIWMLALGFFATFLFAGVFVAVSEMALSSRVNDAVARMELVRQSQVHFKLQVQEWKNILIRGSDPEAYKKHLIAFRTESTAFQALLQKLIESETNSDTKSKAIEIQKRHSDLLKQYEVTLEELSAGSPDFTRAADRRVKGMDRPTDQQLSALVELISNQSKGNQERDLRLFWISLGSAGLIVTVLTFLFSWMAVRSVSNTLGAVTGTLQQISEGKLNLEIDDSSSDERGTILSAVKRSSRKIAAMLLSVRDQVHQTRGAAFEISGTAKKLMKASQNLAASSEESAAAVEELSAISDHVSDSMTVVAQNSKEVDHSIHQLATESEEMRMSMQTLGARNLESSNRARSGLQQIQIVSESMEQVKDGSQKIGAIMSLMHELSDRINLLALNASIEAARAGEAGRGFAVVAEEVSRMADRTMARIKEVETNTSSIQSAILESHTQVLAAADSFGVMMRDLLQMGDSVSGFATRVDEQVSRVSAIAASMQQLSNAASTVEGAAKESKNAARELAESTRTNASEADKILHESEALQEVSGNMRTRADQLGQIMDEFSLDESNQASNR
ncbi:MAG TPA: methyl-accepting chemotaxis protein [Leptospiraceae bacterium]|nr:methyl-accepting chemotaxis protein [Leptospirales bacterium]HMU82991.1 methyl-accepting chemotaxis protein [Leptospiraceae bacterium]HMW60109.1 methyl-accepting chemotaxis protein [Leptospiraceae bacterium]HMX55261.1 methyl-accepting chemotaxis protein [Leptospiraceae bacterium]HMZ36841.1 methyl-accepting chemotaxis protein [Leptospiraceae bacterium]